MQVLIRADASPRIGIGHVRRCLTLARALTRYGAVVQFAAADCGEQLIHLLAEFGDNVILLPAGRATQSADPATWLATTQAADFEAVVSKLGGRRPDWIVVDHYALDREWHDHARRELGCKVLAVDDLANRPLAADLVVDPNWQVDLKSKYRRVIEGKGELMGGPSYALVEPAYAAGRDLSSIPNVQSIGIFMGGSDPTSATLPAIKSTRAAGFSGPIQVVTSGMNPQYSLIQQAALFDGQVFVETDRPDLVSFFEQSDFFILAAGSTTWERMASGSAGIAVVTADNQREIAFGLSNEGLQWVVEDGDWAGLEALLPAALADEKGRHDQALRGGALIDGKGADRIALAMLTLGDMPVRMRRAELADASLILEWRNDPSIRAASRSDAEIAPDTHHAWFNRVVSSDDHIVLIAEKSSLPIGLVRFDKLDERQFELSIFLNPLVAGRGLGLAVVKAAHETFVQTVGGPVVVHAETLPHNQASKRLFQNAGYQQLGDRFKIELSDQ